VDGVPTAKNDTDQVGGGGFAIGYDWRGKGLPMRSEIEYVYRFRFDFDTRVNGGTDSDFEMNISTHSVMLNVYYDYVMSGSFTPYVGVGLGWSRNSSEGIQNKLDGNARQDNDHEEDNFAWSLMLGVNWDFAQNWRFKMGYRFIHLGDIESGQFPDGGVVGAEDYTSHDVTLGITYRF
jgi:opacity protein-like surface antigen